MSRFTHLATHSFYSFMRGTASPERLCRAARERGMDTLALTDIVGVYGAVFFWQAALEEGVKPIIGADVRTDKERAVLLVKNPAGYSRLCRILTDLHLNGGDPERLIAKDAKYAEGKNEFLKPSRPSCPSRLNHLNVGCPENVSTRKSDLLHGSISQKLLEDKSGLVVLSDDAGLLGALVENGARNDVYFALPSAVAIHELPLRFAKDNGVPIVAVGEVYFVDRNEYELHRLLRAIDLNTTLGRVPVGEMANERAWLASPEEMLRRLPNHPEAVENAAALAEELVMSEPPWSGLIFPAFEGLDADSAFRLLREKCYSGARDRYGAITPPVSERLEYELDVIRRKGFANYFLVVEDIVTRFPLTCGRGSAAASIVSYALKITHVDPIRHNLFFERFLNPGRVDPPDIDVDFPWDERDDVLEYVFRKYGERGAAMVSNHVSFQGRAAVREVAKVFGLPDGEIARVAKRMAHLWSVSNPEEVIRTHPMFKDLELEAPWPDILRLAGKLEGIPRHLSVHCGGAVIAPGELDKRVPSQRAAKILAGKMGASSGSVLPPPPVNVVQWEKDQAEDAGLVKIDLLGNRSLAVIRDSLEALRKNYGLEIDYRRFNPLDDPDTIDLLARGDTIGVFYVESPAMRLLQQKTGRGDFDHLVIHSSIIRPAANYFIREYVRRLRGGAYEPLHPLLEEILRETYGIMCYQEDVTKTAMAMAGFDAVDGDGLRKIMAKKHRTKKLNEYKEQFYRGATERGVSRETIDKIWDMIMSFSGYSFCKPHSASYALVSFKSAWLRAHYPAEFMAAVISNQGGYYSTFAYVSEARRMGLSILPPDINESMEHYTGVNKSVRIGFMQVKGLTKNSLEAVIAERKKGGPYCSFDDFLGRALIAPSDAELLVKAGCFDSLERNSSRPALLWKIKAHVHRNVRRRSGPSLSLFDAEETSRAMALPNPQNYDGKTLLRQEVETLGFLASRHPLSLYREQLKPGSYVPARDLRKWVGRKITTLGWYVTGKLVETKHGEPMEFLSFEDTTAIYETTFFPEAYRKFCHMIDRERPFLLYGKVEEDFGAITLTVDRVKPVEVREKLRHRRGFYIEPNPATIPVSSYK